MFVNVIAWIPFDTLVKLALKDHALGMPPINFVLKSEHFISALNWISIAIDSCSPGFTADVRRSSCPGTNLVIIGPGPTHFALGTYALKAHGSIERELRQPLKSVSLLIPSATPDVSRVSSSYG